MSIAISSWCTFMNIGIDIRALLGGQKTGVGEYTYELLHAICAYDSPHQFFLFANARTGSLPVFSADVQKRAELIALRYPNIFFHASLFALRFPALDRL